MTEFSLSKLFTSRQKSNLSLPGGIAYALFVLICFWVGAQLLHTLTHAPGMLEHLMQERDAGRPHIDMGLAVSTLFGLIPFLSGGTIVGAVILLLRRGHYS